MVKYLAMSIATMFMLQSVKELANQFPGSLYKAQKLIHMDKNKFTEFVYYPDCGELYNSAEAICFDNKTTEHQ